MNQASYHGSRASLLGKLRELPGILSGRIADPTQVAQGLLGAVGLQALALIKDAYVTKSRGGTDDAGIQWAPLSPKTIAYGRRHPKLTARRRYAAKAGRSRRPLLTAGQDKLWRQIFVRVLRRLEKLHAPDAKAHAAAAAWAVVKRAGGKTILEEYGKTPVEIGRDTGRLLNSLSPGHAPQAANADQIFRVEPGAVTVGTNVKYAEPYHRRRPLWPDDPAQVPASWYERLGQIVTDALPVLLVRKLG